MTSREQLIATMFVDLADTLVDDFDVIDFLHTLARRSVELLDASAAGIMLADQRGGLRVMASSTEEVCLLELYELQNNQGTVFAERMRQRGFQSAQAVPMRLRAEAIGALNIFRSVPGPLSDSDMRLAKAMADVATVGLLQERAIAERELLATQLQTALTSRIQLEQAKGVLAERAGLELDQAFTLMRDYARSHNRRLSQVAAEIIDGSIDLRAGGGPSR